MERPLAARGHAVLEQFNAVVIVDEIEAKLVVVADVTVPYLFFFGGVRGLNLRPYIYYELSLPN